MKLVQESRFKKKNFKIKPQEMMFTNQTQQKTSPKIKFLTPTKPQKPSSPPKNPQHSDLKTKNISKVENENDDNKLLKVKFN